jgi:hypothetical protein
MARTRQTSGKTVGGPAKRGTLPLKKNTRRVAAKRVFNGPTSSTRIRKDLTRLKPQRWNLVSACQRDSTVVYHFTDSQLVVYILPGWS